ncbi:HD-GYP domain-containing protein [Cellvibrio japonicus]|nr:HD-GYP domain-containing protein [Cellvibrio japonicus]QEI14220.1 HD-GYP domain-containing protein [Cellvibrio japonicus]QEI17797.1 HD-GYP domain-containing protein [Cellvibrio japonicus]QEI21372.1 HD-GYP domain-containing protein [Cellvibrio japonicus]
MDAKVGSIKIHISELKIGMFVSKLDRDWLETPFLMQGFMIESLDDIDTVAEYAEYVWVDAVKEEWVPPETRAVSGSPIAKAKSYVNKVDAQQEHRAALGVYREARRLTKSLLDDARFGGVINTEAAKATVKDCVHSVLRNPDALLWMARMRNEDEYTSEHCLNVCILAVAFGRHLGMNESELEKLGLCGLLHDVGKMRVPQELLNKVEPLSEKEFNMVRAHATHGRNLLMSSPGVPNVAVDVAYSHHERVDGEGYPRKLKASGISDYARIISIVDAYDAMTADRCYSRAIPSTDALKRIFQDRGSHFDERLALEFIKCVGLYPPGSLVELVNGLIGIVLETNNRFRHLPKIIVVMDLIKPLEKEQVISLEEVEQRKLDKTYLIKRALRDGSHGIFIREYREKGLVFRY